MHLIGWLSLCHLVVFFLELNLVFCVCFVVVVFVSVRLVHSKGWGLRCSPWQGNRRCIVTLSVEDRSRGNSATCSTLCQFSVTSPTSKLGPSDADFQWVGLCTSLVLVLKTIKVKSVS